MLYTYTSAVGNNGSAFAGINANTPVFQYHYRNRHAVRPFPDADPAAGRRRQPGAKETGPGFGRHFPHPRTAVRGLLVGVIVIVGALTFFPALSLGPVVEHFLMNAGKLWS
jgi:K+-transporting ATPase ATPase A chain